ncbi:MAG: hypothetical protein ING60_11480 [Rhodocyclaceae bacterium]|nr:hypothetical protein [Rhodocyclaceae bacterium]
MREALGVRRELSFVNLSRRGPFSNPYLPLAPLKPLRYADPPSHMVFAYSTKYSKGKGPLADWQIPSQQFDIELWNLVL